MGAPWSEAQHRKFSATMRRKRKASLAPTEIPIDAVSTHMTRVRPPPTRGEPDVAIAFSRSRKELVLVIDDAQFPFKVIE